MDSQADMQLFGTSELSFDKDIFMRPDFNVDDFMREYQSGANLENLRDQLGIYLKILRSAMIDLINRDYADFVNLSTNLTGLDNLIQALTVPLGQLREEVLSVSQLLESASNGVLTDLQKQKTVNNYKRKLSTLSDIAKRLDNLEDLMQRSNIDSGETADSVGHHADVSTSEADVSTNHADLSANQADVSANHADASSSYDHATEEDSLQAGIDNLCLEVCHKEELLDRFAAELSYLNYLSSSCDGSKLMNIYRPRLNRIQSAVEGAIERNLKASLGYTPAAGTAHGTATTATTAATATTATTATTDVPLLKRTLTACVVMDSAAVAEEVVRELLAPAIRELLSVASLRNNPRGLPGVLATLLAHITASTAPLLALTVPRRHLSSAVAEEVPGYRFLEHSVFPEVCAAFTALPDFYSPANPSAFHQRYLHCLDFLESLEQLLVTRQRVDSFRSLETYNKFMEQWNLAVYFQIRNQEIGQVVESSLCEEAGLRLYLSTTADDSPADAGCGGSALLGSSRGVMGALVQCWLPDVFLQPLVHRFWKLTLLVLARHRTWLDATLNKMQEKSSPAPSSRPGSRQAPQHKVTPTVHTAVYLLSDLTMLGAFVATLYEAHIATNVQHVPDQHRSAIRATLATESSKLSASHQSLLTLIASHVSAAMSAALQPVTDTPRLYRRTNRSAPSHAQPYVALSVAPLQQLHQVAGDRLDARQLHYCYAAVCASVSSQYHTLTSEVLGNVSKTEESLRRLKRARGTAAVTSPQGAGLTDEDKIREQLQRDVEQFGAELRALGVSTDSVPEYVTLSDTVREARTGVSATTVQAVA